MSNINQIASDLYKVLTEADERKTKPYDTKAEVVRTEGNTAWVKIPGGVEETPVQKTNNANPGDTVMVRVSGGRAWLLGNNTSPATDDTQANAATQLAVGAGNLAEVAAKAASDAQESAGIAYSYADQAKTSAEQAQENAEDAQESADSAKQSADTAFKQLSVVEDIVGVLDLISKNGDYRPTQDTEVIPDKWYFTRSGTDPNYVYNIATIETFYRKTEDTEIEEGKTYYTRSGTAPDYVYTPVENPVVEDIDTYYEAYQDPSQQGLYELFGIDSSIQNYVSSHLVLTGNVLSLRTDGSDYRLDLTSTGMQVIGANGLPIATYGTETIVGREDGFHIKMDGNELGFYRGAYKIAYLSGEKLYIPQSVVLQQMDVGLPYGHIDPTTQQQDGFGQWSWKLHLNNENPPRNNLNLKWIG